MKNNSMEKNRPISPHLSVYKLQITSGLSILHRITGAYLYFGLVIFAWLIFTLVYYPDSLEAFIVTLGNNIFLKIISKLMLFGWTFALFYHQLNGLRHLFWDIGKGFDLKTATRTGWLVFILAIMLTFGSWFLACKYYSAQNVDVIPEAVIIEENE
ncbi:MAG: succinate dehydrogenase, cytochrome b556 subunit [Pseudomonadota bacterium]